MSEGNVVRRDPKNNRRKNTDGYRTDSGCFEDVDVQMANRNSPTSTSSESVVVDSENIATTDRSSEECRLSTEHTDACPISLSLADECADDKDFHAILKRLSDITTNPGDLYRLCFSSRLSFCGHMSGNTENEESFSRTAEIDENDNSVTAQANGCNNSEIPNDSHFETAEKGEKRSSHGQQCVELLSLLSSFMVKAKENPNVFNQSSLGNSLTVQLSSLLSTLEEAKKNAKQPNESQSIVHGQREFLTNPQPSTPFNPLPVPKCTALSTSNGAKHKASLNPQDSNPVKGPHLNQRNTDDPLPAQNLKTQSLPLDPNTAIDDKTCVYHKTQPLPSSQAKKLGNAFIASTKLNTEISKTDLILREDPRNQNHQPLSSRQREELEITLPSSDIGTRLDENNVSLKDLFENHNKLPLALTETDKLETPLPTSSLKTSFATNRLHLDVHKTYPSSKHPSDNRKEKPPLLNKREEFQASLPISNLQTPVSTTSHKTRIDNTDPILQHPSNKNNQYHSSPNGSKGNNPIPDLNIIEGRSSTSSVTDAGNVVTNGRRAVKPYSWDYGDIWEKELERAKTSESFLKDPAKDMMPSFEEIRDELFYNAGFIYDSDGRFDGTKRRSRSADARSNLEDDNLCPEYHNTQNEMHSPFVRTVYQNEAKPSTGLRRSWSSGDNSVMVSVDWTHGRQMRVITGSSDQGFDDARAQFIKEAVVKTSTFRGPKPWSVLKRRPSGLRRRSEKNESFRSNTSDESCARLDNDSESSDSPYVSATSSDCLMTATDDSSSVTSSQYYATSSLPSSPSVSNRNSACFSDTSTSDASDIRRVVFQSPPSKPSSRELYTRGYNTLATHGMTLDQRFGYIGKHNGVSPKEGLQTTSSKTLGGPLLNADDFHKEESQNLRGHNSTLPRKWQGDRLMSPLLVRSDSDLNRLTKVEFVGDSYSRSRISKNVRHTRNRSQSPSPVGSRSAHTRVVSCEIVQSHNGKRDVYTKVNIAESLNDEEETKIHDDRKMKLGYPSTRRSWHGQSPTRVSSRYSPTNKNMAAASGSLRYFSPPGSIQQQRHISHSRKGTQAEKPVHATLVAVNNHQNRMRTHWSTGSLRMPPSERPRLLSDNVVMNRPHGHSTINCDVHPNFERNFKGGRSRNVGRDQAVFRQPSDVGIRSGRRRSPPDYFTAIKHSQGLQRQRNQSGFPGCEKHFANTDKGFSTGRNLPIETKPKEPMSHIVKETSFVGPSTFTKYQPSSNPSFTRTRRSRSLNEKDTMSRRRLHDSDIYRRRAMEISQSNHSDGEYLSHFSRCDSDVTAVHRPDRRRRYSEGGTRRPPRHDFTTSDGVVDASYCDPRRESIREGTYSIVNAESAREGVKLDDTRLLYQTKGEAHAPLTRVVNEQKIALQNDCKNESEIIFNDFDERRRDQSNDKSKQVNSSHQSVPEEQWKIAESKYKKVELVKPGKTILQHEKRNKKSSDDNDFTDEHGQEMRYSGSRSDQAGNSKAEEKFSFNKPGCDRAIFATSSPPHENMRGGSKIEEVNYFVDMHTPQKEFLESKSKQMERIKSDRNSRTKSTEENNLPVLSYKDVSEESTGDSSCKESSYRNTGESGGSLPKEEEINKTDTVVPVSKNTDEASPVILAQELPLNNMDENRQNSYSLLPYEENDKANAVVPNQVVLPLGLDEANEIPLATEFQFKKNENNTVISQHFPYAKKDKINTTVSQQELFPHQQVDEIDGLVSPLSQYENMDGKNSVVYPIFTNETKDKPNVILASVLSNSNPVDSGEVDPNQEKEETNIILSPILPNRKTHDQMNEVNVFIDYRNKRPISVEYSDEDISFLKTLGSTARASRKVKQNGSGERRVKTGRNNASCTVLDADISNRTEQNMKNYGEVCHSRLSRKDRHEKEVLTSKVRTLQKDQHQFVPVSNHQPSPEPYRRDSTILYTDARTSFGSDTDSISRDSTVSSSGSDMTVILHEDMDISVDDLRQLTENGSKIGIEIAPIDVETCNDLLDSGNDIPTEMPPAMELSKTFKSYQRRVPENSKSNPQLVLTKEASTLKENVPSPENISKKNTLKRLIDGKNNEKLSSDNLVSSSYSMQSSCSSIASSRASSKSTGTESSKINNSSKTSEGGKGFFSRLKSFRNSFRVKKSDNNSFDRKRKMSKNSQGKIKECEDICDGSEDVSRQFPSNTDDNANVLLKHRNRTKSDTGVVNTKSTEALSRRSYDVFRHPNNSLRSVVGVKSVSSDHLNTYRINNTPHMNEINAKSLEVLVETCI